MKYMKHSFNTAQPWLSECVTYGINADRGEGSEGLF